MIRARSDVQATAPEHGELGGLNAMVTGAGRGIGLAIATRLADAGAGVALVDRDGDAVAEAGAAFNRTGHRFVALVADVADTSSVHDAVERTSEALGPVHILVNNAGILRDRRIVNMTDEDWDSVMAVNLRSQFLCCRAVAGGMISRGFGRIVNIASRAWLGAAGQANYAASKGGVVSLTRSLALELARHGITVNAVAPGIIETEMLQSLGPDRLAKLAASVPAERIGTPDDVASLAVFLARPDIGYITGQTIHVCGGRSLASG